MTESPNNNVVIGTSHPNLRNFTPTFAISNRKSITRSHNILDHIVPSTNEITRRIVATNYNQSQWSGSLESPRCIHPSMDVCNNDTNSILVIDDTDKAYWNKISSLFHDNKHSRLSTSKINSPTLTLNTFHPPRLTIITTNSLLIS
jgi:hypothetical protein